MSGIAGIIRFDGAPPDPALVRSMTGAMAHRGPDGINHLIRGAAALGHCMLRTTPEALEETQPLTNDGDRLVLVMDGRIDNWEDLRARLTGAGVRLRDRSDAELVLRAYEQWGVDCLRHLEGDFAFVIWDAIKREAFCARDQLGARPFYYHWDGRRFSFASELHAVLALPWVPERLNEGMVAEIASAPQMVSRDSTLWCGLRRLVAAHQMVVDERQSKIERYWSPDLESEIRYRRQEEYVEHYRALLYETVRRHSRSHLPLACEVSGGIDSSSVFSVGEHLQRSGRLSAPDIAGFTLRFDDGSAADEVAYATAVGEHLGRNIHEIAPFLPSLEWHENWVRRFRDFPHYPNTVMALSLYEDVRRIGMRTVLTGYGGDEWQMGTRYYYADFIADLDLRNTGRSLLEDCRHYGISTAAYWFARCGILPYLPTVAQTMVKAASASLKGRPPDPANWLTPELRRALSEQERHRSVSIPPSPKKRHAASLEMLSSAMRAHNVESFCALASSVGVERRDPLNSLPIVRFHFATPERIRARANQYRRSHREAVRPLLPSCVTDRPNKAHFAHVVRRHLAAFEAGGAYPLAPAAPSWVTPEQVARRMFLGQEEDWALWTLWGLFGCVLVDKHRNVEIGLEKLHGRYCG